MTAQVAISAQYFPAYARIPRKAQRKADEFIRKFQHDPRQASIHYEPIGNVVDKRLRSVRVGDDYRAIVRAPESGDIFILLYIDHHDEAYRWAEGKQLQVHPATGTLQFFDVDEASAAVSTAGVEEGSEAEGTHTVYERRLFSEFSDEQLFVGGVPQALLPAVRALYTEGDLDKLLPHIPQEAADLLTGLAAGYGYDEVLEALLTAPKPASDAQLRLPEPGLTDAEPPPAPVRPPPRKTTPPRGLSIPAMEVQVDPEDWAAALRRESTQAEFRLLDEDFDLDQALAYPLDAWRIYLHPTQKKIARARTKGPMRLTGGAGTGKTVVAIHRAAWLLREVFTAPDERLLFTTFTKNLAADIRGNLEKLLEPEEMPRVEVTSLDAWASEYLRSEGIMVRLATDDLQRSAWNSAFDLYGVDGFDLSFCKTEWEAVIQAEGIRDEETYVRAVRHHRGKPISRADRRKLWEVFREYRAGLEAARASEFSDILRLAREVLERKGERAKYCSVIVDEVQDFSPEALKLVRAIAGPERANDLFLVGDAHQRIYGRPVPLSQCGINVRGRRSRTLRLNYRTTAAICRWSIGTLGSGSYDDLDGGKTTTRGLVSLRSGTAPTVRHFQHQAEEAGFVAKEVQSILAGGTLPEEVCIVARKRDLLEGLYMPALAALGIDAEILGQRPPRANCVRLATMHRVKGLEFPIVFASSVCDAVLPLATPALTSDDSVVAAQAERQERCLLYVAASRARDRLFVTSYGVPSPFLEDIAAPRPATRPEPEDSPSARDSRAQPPSDVTATPEPEPEVVPVDAVAPAAEQKPLGGAAALLDVTPLHHWPLPTRMANWLSRHEIATVGQLLALDPSQLLKEKNLGRKSIAVTDQLIRERLGSPWRDLRAGASATAQASETLSADLEETLQQPLYQLQFSVRFSNWAERVGAQTLRDLALWHPLQLMQEKNVGRGTVGEARSNLEKRTGRRWEELHRALIAGPAPELPTLEELRAREKEERERGWSEGFFSALRGMFVDLDTIPRMIITRRAGLGGSPETLEDIGATLGVTRERVRQIEKKTWDRIQQAPGFVEYVEGRCRQSAPDGAVDFEKLACDSWWNSLSDEPDALDYFCDRLLDGKWRVLKIGEDWWLAEGTQKEFDAALAAAKRRARELRYPCPLGRVRAEIDGVAGELTPGLRDQVWGAIEEQLALDVAGSEPRAIAFGGTKAAQIRTFLERQDGPISINQLLAEVGRGALPEEVFFFGHGIVGLEKHFPDFPLWKERVAPLAVRLIRENGPEKQWSCADLLLDLKEEIELPDWFGYWHLAAVLRRSEAIEYLGRLRVALPGVVADSVRMHVHDVVEDILKTEGAPLDKEELAARLRQRVDVSDIALVGVLNRPAFLRLDRSRWGLMARDLPGGVEAMSEALDELEAVLERRGRGLAARFVQREVSKLSALHGEWSEETCLSVVRSDPRFRCSISGSVGLASWESTRVPSRVDVVRESLERAHDQVSVGAIQDRIAALYGSAPDRVHLGQMANRFGWRLEGDELVRVPTE